jgi:hypothetical protein
MGKSHNLVSLGSVHAERGFTPAEQKGATGGLLHFDAVNTER